MRRQEKIQLFRVLIGKSKDRFAEAWTWFNVTQANREMRQTIETRRPDLVLVGSSHLKGLKGAENYSTFQHDEKDWKPNTFLSHLVGMIHSQIGQYLPDEVRDDIIRNAGFIQPHFNRLVFRAFSHEDVGCFQALNPGFDIEFFKMSVEEAKVKVIEALALSLDAMGYEPAQFQM